MRALSVIFVILTHLGIYGVAVNAGYLSDTLAPIISGTTGVQIFFVLSGFLITSLLIHEHKQTGTVSLKGFYFRRAFRILPLYFLCLFLTFFVDVFVWDVATTKSLVYAALFHTSFIAQSDYASILGHTWSLSVEEHFYVLWPAALLYVYRFNMHRAMIHLGAGAAISLICLTVVLRMDEVTSTYFVGRWSFFAGSWIALGCIGAIVLNGNYRRCHALLTSRFSLGLGAVLFLHSLALGLIPRPLDEVLRVSGILLIICWIALNQKSFLVRALEYEPLAYIGKISYGLYMWQGFILSTGPGRMEGQLWPIAPGFGLILLCVVAPLSYHYFEKYFLKMSARYRHANGIVRARAKPKTRPTG